MKRATEPKLRSALAHLLDAERRLAAAKVERDEAARVYNRAATERTDSAIAVALLLEEEGGVVIHDNHSFERMGQTSIRIVPVVRELRTEQETLPLEAAHA